MSARDPAPSRAPRGRRGSDAGEGDHAPKASPTRGATTEEALRASEAYYRGLIEQLGDGIAVVETGGDGRLTVVNERLCEMTGYSREELLALRIPDLVTDAEGDELPARLDRLARGETLLTRRRLRRKDGTLLTTEISTRQIGSRIQAVVRDVTERELFEQHRRTAQKLEALGLLAGSVAHDFNNFLLAIQSNLELAMSTLAGGAPPEVAELVRTELEEIRRVARRAAGLTRQLLTFSRRQSHPPSTFRLAEAVTEIEHMLRLLVRPLVELVVRGVEDTGYVRADIGQLEQVLMNLVVNARDAMRDGGVVTVELSSRTLRAPLRVGVTRQRIPAGHWVVLSVSDTGTGMTPETAARMFEPLFTTKPAGAGTGFGLWTVQAVVTQAGGYVSVDTTPGAGSTFSVWLPAVDPEEDHAEAAQPEDLVSDTAARA